MANEPLHGAQGFPPDDSLESAEEKLRHYYDQLEASNRELKNFAYIVSHDLRAPLVNIKGFSSELKLAMAEVEETFTPLLCQLEEKKRKRATEILQEELPEALEFIGSSINRMDTLIESILKLSRIGHKELKFESIDVEPLVQEILKTLTHQLDQRQVEVTVGSLPQIVADRITMQQVFGNLLDNAVKFLEPSRPGKLQITAQSKWNKIVFHIKDNGRGIAPEETAKVFEIFRRAGRQDVQGEGMGLAYVKSMVHNHGGTIWCESELGVGSTFSFTVPIVENYPEPQELEDNPLQ